MRRTLPSSLIALILALILALIPAITADPLSIPFQDCFDEPESAAQKLHVDTVYAQVSQNDQWGRYLNLTVLGTSPQPIVGVSNESTSLSTLFTTSSVLTLSAWSNSSYLCQTMRPPTPLPAVNSTDGTFCPIPAGPFAFSATIPWGRDRELTTLLTRLRAVDPFGKSLVCLDVLTTPLSPLPHAPYGRASIIFWTTVGLASAYWLIGGVARVASAWSRGSIRAGGGGWARARSAGYILASAISGERLATAPALMRFCTPSLRDVFFHTQWCAVLVMVAVEWPQFVYPLLTQTAWSTLTYNISLTPSSHLHHVSPLSTTPFEPPTNFADQLTDPQSPLFIDPSIPNTLFTLPPSSSVSASQSIAPGIPSFAYTLGIRPQDLFPTCFILFLGIIAATIVLSILVWFIDYTMNLLSGAGRGSQKYDHGGMARLGEGVGTRSPPLGYGSASSVKELARSGAESPPLGNLFGMADENKTLVGHGAHTSPSPHTRFAMPGGLASSDRDRGSGERGISSHRTWWTRLRASAGAGTGAFHGSVLHGNLVRLLVLFHLPLTVFACYHLTLGPDGVGSGQTVIASLSLVIFSILLPAHLILRIAFTSTSKLYSETRTLLSLGPLYSHYRAGSQLFALLFFVGNVAFGVVIGAGQKSGTAQAIVILVVEVALALITSVWLPWGAGASMGLISFLFCVARIVVAVLLVILTQAISIGPGPGGWVAYGILIILSLVYLALLLMLITKLIEGTLRLMFGISFDRSKHISDTGLLGVLGLLGCCGGRRRRRSGSGAGNRRKRHSNRRKGSSQMDRDSDLSSYMPPLSSTAVAAAAVADGTATPPRFLHADSRKGSTYSQPPSVLKPEHANRPYREEGPLGGEEDEGYIMGAWQPFPRTGAAYVPLGSSGDPMPSSSAQGGSGMGLGIAASGYKSPTSPATTTMNAAQKSTGGNAAPSPSGFSRVGGGRAHIDSPYAINGGSTQTFPSLGQQSVQSQTGTGHTGAAYSQQNQHRASYSNSNPSASVVTLTPGGQRAPVAPAMYDDEPAMSFSSVEMGVGNNGLPPGAMQPAHIRTKSQTAIVEDYLPVAASASSSGSKQFAQQQQQQPSSWDLQNQPAGTRQTHVSEDTYLKPPTRFTVGGNDDDDDDESGDEQGAQKRKRSKPWYHIRRNRAHSSDGRTTPSASASAAELGGAGLSGGALGAGAGRSSAGNGGGGGAAGAGVDTEMGGLGKTAQPQRSFVVIRKPPGSMGRLNQAAGSSSNATYPSSTARPPTR